MSVKCSILLFVAAAIALVSCKNNDNVFKPAVSTYFNVVNASADTLNIFINGTRQNNSSSLFPGSQSFYLVVPAGAQNYQFKKAGTATALFNLPLNLKDSVNTSLYVYGEAMDKTFSTTDALFLDTNANTTQIRFVNVSPDAGNLNASVGDTVKFNDSQFKTSSVFKPTGSGLKRVQIFQAGIATAKVDTSIVFQAGRIYTLFSKGLISGTGNSKFNVGIVINY